MKILFTLLTFVLVGSLSAQTTVYTTGQSYTDAWTGWTTPVVSSTVGSPSINGVNLYTFPFTGSAGQAFTLEYSRAFNINSNDIDIYCAATTQNATLSVEYSEDNSTWTSIGSLAYGAGFAQQTLVIPTFAPGPTNFYLKIKLEGTIASPAQAVINSFKIDADLATESVNISPTAVQNILVGVNGSVLTANETPSSATSREWKYSTTSGSGYMSFATAQTGATYTPNFASVGTYYVICESTFTGSPVSSNEVRINVTNTSGISSFEDNFSINYFNSNLTVNTAQTNYTVAVYNLSGQLIHSEQNLTSLDFTAFDKGVYLVNITSHSTELSKTIKIVQAN